TEEANRRAKQDRTSIPNVPSIRDRYAPLRVPEVSGAGRAVRHPARHDQLVHREACRGREAGYGLLGDEGARGVHLLVEPRLQTGSWPALSARQKPRWLGSQFSVGGSRGETSSGSRRPPPASASVGRG